MMQSPYSNFPQIVFGTWGISSSQCKQIVLNAIDCGYRKFDCAYSYGNDFFVGKAIQESAISREELSVTNKVWNSFRGKENVISACKKSLKFMKLSYFDLYLVHWPVSIKEDGWEDINRSTWEGMETLYQEGLVKTIGLSNFKIHHIESLFQHNIVVNPMVNQIEFHPGLDQRKVVDYCNEKGILVQGWGSLGSGKILNNSSLKQIAAKYGKTIPQICLRWSLQKGVIPVVRSSDINRMKSNLDVYDFKIDDVDMLFIDSLSDSTSFSGFDADDNPAKL